MTSAVCPWGRSCYGGSVGPFSPFPFFMPACFLLLPADQGCQIRGLSRMRAVAAGPECVCSMALCVHVHACMPGLHASTHDASLLRF